jgi:hypothetical protein
MRIAFSLIVIPRSRSSSILHLARLYGSGDLEEPIGKRRLAVVDVRDDREVSNPLLI